MKRITILLNTETKLGKTTNYYLCNSTDEECEQLDVDMNSIQSILNKDNAVVLAYGDAMKLAAHRIKYALQSFTNCKGNNKEDSRGELHYRCYEIPLEEQLGKQHLVNICPDATMSWQSALRKVGFGQASGLLTPAYYKAPCILWKEII